MRLVLCLALAWLGVLPALADPKPKVVSLDYCADQFVLGLADREQIVAVSRDAEAPFSHLRALAKGLPKVRSAAEDVIALKPDLVVRSWGGDARALQQFERLGIRTLQLGYAEDLAGTRRVTLEAADALGQRARGQALIDAIPPAHNARGETALYLTPGGVTAGSGTLVDSIMAAAGLANATRAQGWTSFDLETLVQSPPQLVLQAFFGFGTDKQDAWSVSRHPAMKDVLKQARTIALDESRLTCPAWFVAHEAEAIAQALEAPKP